MNLLRFFAPSPASDPLTDPEAIRSRYTRLRWSVFLSATLGYGLYYVCRLSLNVIKKPIVDAGVLSETELGIIGSGLFITYAVGKLVLWSADANKIKDGKALLASGDFNKCAVANPKLAPYGLAAHETLKSLKLFDKVSPKFVEGDNIGKTFNFVKTANADIGFVALSQVYKNGKITSGSGWIVPAELYGKIAQDAVLLKQGKNQDAAKEFLKFLQGPEAAKVKLDYGYGDK